MERPRLDDPAEYAIIKKVYFDDTRPLNEEIDTIEKLERIESREKNNINNAR